ncbi:Anoctamin-5 [Orchesella cincta]|uniref:Anoctamin n=1 Tax=Orchesella cincta TaxID=48709 RepID=A0A1D2NFV4_ORCCI|nr:Anoctamin-5 [Orchesella cincta]
MVDKPTGETTEVGSFWKNLHRLKLFDYNHERIPAEPSFFLASFSRQKEECFIIKDRETFFTPAQRSQIVWKILTRTGFDEKARDKPGVHQTGIRRLLNDKTFSAAFPLHDGPYDEDDFNGEPNDRRLLYTEWAHFGNWYKKQPLWLIRRYFGDKVGLYFAWLGFYTAMLIPASVVGILCFLFGVVTVGTDYNTPSREICNETVGGKTIMCPLCGKCDLWQLQDSCTFSKLTYFFDNPATVFFAIFMAFWATSFLEFWKRKHAVISWEWDLHNYEVEEEPRPEFEAAVTTFRINPVTQTAEPYLSFWSKALRMVIVSSLVFLLLFIVAFVVVGIIIYRLVMMSLLYTPRDSTVQDKTEASDTRIEFFQDNAKIITSVTAAIINLVIVVFLHNRVYYNVAIWLTNSEYPRTQTEYEDSFTFKMFLFQFINYYSKMSNWCRRIKYSSAGDPDAPGFLTRWEQDYNLKKADQLAFETYLRLITHFYTCEQSDGHLWASIMLALIFYSAAVIQYGFVTLFVAAFPLAPFFALLNNVVEIRLDAYKWITQLRRPLAERVEDIGAWYGILQGITYTAVVTNAFVIAYTSDIIPRLVYKYTNEHGTLEGYIKNSLSVYPTNRYNYTNQQKFKDNATEICYYRGYYEQPKDNDTAPFQPTYKYYHIQAARLAFVAVFEHLAFALTGVMAFAIPDVPREISVQIQREKLLATEALYESDLARLKRESEAHTLDLEEVGARRASITLQNTFLTQIQHSMETQQQLTRSIVGNNSNGNNAPPNPDLNRLNFD